MRVAPGKVRNFLYPVTCEVRNFLHTSEPYCRNSATKGMWNPVLNSNTYEYKSGLPSLSATRKLTRKDESTAHAHQSVVRSSVKSSPHERNPKKRKREFTEKNDTTSSFDQHTCWNIVKGKAKCIQSKGTEITIVPDDTCSMHPFLKPILFSTSKRSLHQLPVV